MTLEDGSYIMLLKLRTGLSYNKSIGIAQLKLQHGFYRLKVFDITHVLLRIKMESY